MINENKKIVGVEVNKRSEYLDINNLYNFAKENNLKKIIGSDSHDSSLQFYDDMNFYAIKSRELKEVLKIV